jgi:hypothetical protein
MQYTTTLRNTLAAGVLLLMFNACKKVVAPEPLGDAGFTTVKFIDGLADTASGYYSGYKLIGIDLVATPQTFEFVDVRRDPANNADLNKTMNIIVKNDAGLVTAYDPALTPLPNDAFTVDASTPLVGTDYQVTMKPGEFSKIIKISITNILTQDLTKNYGLGFTITSVDADGKIAAMEKSIVVQISTKNKWDGVYSIEGDFVHPTACLVGPFFTNASNGGPREIELITIGPNSVRRNLGGRENFTVWEHCANNYTYFTAVVPRYQINNDNTVTILDGPGSTVAWNYYAPGAAYDPATKTFNLHYGYNGTRIINETMRYLRPR